MLHIFGIEAAMAIHTCAEQRCNLSAMKVYSSESKLIQTASHLARLNVQSSSDLLRPGVATPHPRIYDPKIILHNPHAHMLKA